METTHFKDRTRNESCVHISSQVDRSLKIEIARKHFEKKGYRVHSGLQFGCELVLYADIPSRVHSDFCVHIPADDTKLNWMTIQNLVRSMPDLHKTLIVANVRECFSDDINAIRFSTGKHMGTGDKSSIDEGCCEKYYTVEEIAIASEHAPFRHRNVVSGVGGQVKKQRST